MLYLTENKNCCISGMSRQSFIELAPVKLSTIYRSICTALCTSSHFNFFIQQFKIIYINYKLLAQFGIPCNICLYKYIIWHD